MVSDLICYEQVLTTEAKARMLRPTAEKMITLAKRGITSGKENPAQEIHARRLAAARIARYRLVKDDDGNVEEVDVVKKLFDDVAPRYMDRPGGYTRLVKIGKRAGDNADMAMLLLVED
ncbi:MAG: 50S ribosomal protein L17 [Chloroflexota bacterium]|nr:MAG: 50S ribosomal protein L17 [Chloroflexota bacterium]